MENATQQGLISRPDQTQWVLLQPLSHHKLIHQPQSGRRHPINYTPLLWFLFERFSKPCGRWNVARMTFEIVLWYRKTI